MTGTSKRAEDELIRVLLNLPASRTVFTKSQRAYVDVRKAVVTHSLPAESPLDESYLLSLFPVGRTPLREALKRLAHEGLLVWTSHQAPSVRDVGAHEMQYLYETRRMIEPTIARLAARRATPDDHKDIEHYNNALVRASEAGDIYDSVEMDFALHAAIARATQNRFLAESSNFLNLRGLRLWYRNQLGHGVDTISVAHTNLINAINERDEDLAEELARKHIANSLYRQTSVIEGMFDFPEFTSLDPE